MQILPPPSISLEKVSRWQCLRGGSVCQAARHVMLLWYSVMTGESVLRSYGSVRLYGSYSNAFSKLASHSLRASLLPYHPEVSQTLSISTLLSAQSTHPSPPPHPIYVNNPISKPTQPYSILQTMKLHHSHQLLPSKQPQSGRIIMHMKGSSSDDVFLDI